MLSPEDLGRIVRRVWVDIKRRQLAAGIAVPPHHLLDYDDPTFPDSERRTDDEIGACVAVEVLSYLAGIHPAYTDLQLADLARELSTQMEATRESAEP